MKFIYTIILLFSFVNIANAGLNGLTIHSRANCVTNESITWDATHYWMLAIKSGHYYFENGEQVYKHNMNTGWENTWRNAAVHWGEGTGGFYVEASHWKLDGQKAVYLGNTAAFDCNTYEGWWEAAPPKSNGKL